MFIRRLIMDFNPSFWLNMIFSCYTCRFLFELHPDSKLNNYYTTITQLFLRTLPFCCTSTSILFHRPMSAAVVRKLFSFSYVNFPKYDIILYRTNTHIKRISSSFSMLQKLWSTIFGGGGVNIFIFLSVLMFFFLRMPTCTCITNIPVPTSRRILKRSENQPLSLFISL